MPRLACIGLGARATGMVKLMAELDPQVVLAGLVDPQPQAVRERIKQHGLEVKNVRVFETVESLVQHAGDFDGVLIGTRCHLHTEMAVRVAASGLPLFLEKPVAISEAQVADLAQAYAGREDRVVVSFPLRTSEIFVEVMKIMDSGRLGQVNQIQAVNYVTYGGVYYGTWYRNWEQTHGLWLQKATHDFDYIHALAGCRPTTVTAMESRKIYGGEMPPDLKCSKCDRTATCPESPQAMKRRDDTGGMVMDKKNNPEWDHECAFGKDIRHHDAASAIIMFENGVHAVYNQNFVSRRSAHARGATVTGYEATLKFEWYTDTIEVIDHHAHRVDKIVVKAPSGHFGGDTVLARNFIGVMRGKEKSITPLGLGLTSAAACLAAQRSCETQTFQPVVVPRGAPVTV